MTRWHPQVPISCVQQQETGSINRNWKMGEKTLTSTAEEKLCKMNDVKGQNSFRGNMKQQRRHIGPPDATGRKLSDAEVQEKASTETKLFVQEVTPTESFKIKKQ
ncbi:hypothetical protein Tco_0568041 [Tanacetum coccineum]